MGTWLPSNNINADVEHYSTSDQLDKLNMNGSYKLSV